MAGGIAIIGAGRIGQKRAEHSAGVPILACADLVASRAQALTDQFPGAVAYSDWKDCLRHDGVNIIIVSTINRYLAEITSAAVQMGKHVLVEKPAGRRSAELSPIIEHARTRGVAVKVGFNLRFHPALRKAKEMVDAGAIGPLMFLRGRYGHGGRLGYEREWRADPKQAGGGELIDQGVHLIDLSRWLLGEFSQVDGHVTTSFWDMPVDDNAFLSLRTSLGQTAWLHASCSEWKNLFSLEIYGRQGKLHIEGLGGSYGVERLTHYAMRPEMGPPDTTAWEFPGQDDSWTHEFQSFLESTRGNPTQNADILDAYEALKVVEAVYDRSSTNSSLRRAG